MELSLAGILVALALLLLDRWLGGHLLFALLGSLAFGATAVATISSLGFSSPQIFTLFAMAIIGAVFLRRDFASSIKTVFKTYPVSSWIVLLLTIYVIWGAYFSPRIFEGYTLVFVRIRTADGSGVVGDLIPLAPSRGNITQGCYFVLSTLAFLAVSVTLLDPRRLYCLKIAAFGYVVLIISAGLVDLLGKLAGFGDVLEPIRTAHYSMMTSEQHAIAGFPRINGAHSEASAYAAVLVPCLAFVLAYWRYVRKPPALLLGCVLLGLLAFSTSTTAYVAASVCAAWLGLCIGATLFVRGQFRASDLVLLAFGLCAAAFILGVFLADEKLLTPFQQLFEITILNKSTSSSGISRAASNNHALQSLLDTYFIGVGVGSARASSWLVAVVSQLGLLGAVFMAALVIVLFRGLGAIEPTPGTESIVGLAAGCRAAALATVLAKSLVSPGPDPGILFFIMLAGMLACRHHLERDQVSAQSSREPRSVSAPIFGAFPSPL